MTQNQRLKNIILFYDLEKVISCRKTPAAPEGLVLRQE